MVDQKVSLAEPPHGISSGFLSEFWQSREPLPRIKGWEVVWYFLQRGIHTATALPLSNSITVLTIAVSLFLFTGFLLILQNVDKIIADAGSTLHLTVYMKDTATPFEMQKLVTQLEGDKSLVRSLEFVSKDKALQLFHQALGDRSGFLEGLENDNPLPASIEIQLQPDELGINNTERAMKSLRELSFVDEVVYGSQWVERTQGVLRVFRLFGFGTLVVVLSIIVFLIANTIKLVIYARRDEVIIMQLVGATKSYVRLPFILAGAFQGFFGSLMSLLLVASVFMLIDSQIRNSALFGVAVPKLMFLGPLTTFGIIGIGVMVGAVGSIFALGRYMDV